MLRCRRWMLLTATLVARSAFAQQRQQPVNERVVAIAPDAHLEHAAIVALTSWHVEVVSSEGPTPSRDLDDAIRTAHRIARASHARAVVWTAPDATAGAFSLWVYDDATHAIAVRPLPSAPPYDDATAAAIALTLKTLLSSAFDKPAPVHALPDDEPPPPRVAPPRHAVHTFRIETLGGVRMPTNATDTVSARFGAELAWFPSFFAQRLGVALATDAGPSVLVLRDPEFVGTFTDTVASASLRLRLPLRSWFSLELGAGPGLHFSAIEGSAPLSGLSGRVTRVDPSLETMFGFELAWKVLRVSPMASTSFLVHFQHYRVGDVHVLDVPPAQMLFALRVGVEIP